MSGSPNWQKRRERCWSGAALADKEGEVGVGQGVVVQVQGVEGCAQRQTGAQHGEGLSRQPRPPQVYAVQHGHGAPALLQHPHHGHVHLPAANVHRHHRPVVVRSQLFYL